MLRLKIAQAGIAQARVDGRWSSSADEDLDNERPAQAHRPKSLKLRIQTQEVLDAHRND